METLLFDSYRVFQKEYKGSIIRRFFKLPIWAIILFLVMCISVIGGLVLSYMGCQAWSLLCMAVEYVAGIASFLYIENFQLKTIDKRLETYKSYCADILKWLQGTGFVVTQKNILEMENRIIKQIEKQETRNNKRNELIRHIVDVLVIPFLLAIFSHWMTEKTQLGELIVGALTIFTVVGTLGMLAYFLYSLFSFYHKHKMEQLRCFADDLQGVIDTQFGDKLIEEVSMPMI